MIFPFNWMIFRFHLKGVKCEDLFLLGDDCKMDDFTNPPSRLGAEEG